MIARVVIVAAFAATVLSGCGAKTDDSSGATNLAPKMGTEAKIPTQGSKGGGAGIAPGGMQPTGTAPPLQNGSAIK